MTDEQAIAALSKKYDSAKLRAWMAAGKPPDQKPLSFDEEKHAAQAQKIEAEAEKAQANTVGPLEASGRLGLAALNPFAAHTIGAVRGGMAVHPDTIQGFMPPGRVPPGTGQAEWDAQRQKVAEEQERQRLTREQYPAGAIASDVLGMAAMPGKGALAVGLKGAGRVAGQMADQGGSNPMQMGRQSTLAGLATAGAGMLPGGRIANPIYQAILGATAERAGRVMEGGDVTGEPGNMIFPALLPFGAAAAHSTVTKGREFARSGERGERFKKIEKVGGKVGITGPNMEAVPEFADLPRDPKRAASQAVKNTARTYLGETHEADRPVFEAGAEAKAKVAENVAAVPDNKLAGVRNVLRRAIKASQTRRGEDFPGGGPEDKKQFGEWLDFLKPKQIPETTVVPGEAPSTSPILGPKGEAIMKPGREAVTMPAKAAPRELTVGDLWQMRQRFMGIRNLPSTSDAGKNLAKEVADSIGNLVEDLDPEFRAAMAKQSAELSKAETRNEAATLQRKPRVLKGNKKLPTEELVAANPKLQETVAGRFGASDIPEDQKGATRQENLRAAVKGLPKSERALDVQEAAQAAAQSQLTGRPPVMRAAGNRAAPLQALGQIPISDPLIMRMDPALRPVEWVTENITPPPPIMLGAVRGSRKEKKK